MRIHYLIHAPFEKLGAIRDWATAKGYTLTGTHTYRGDPLPSIDEFDLLILMGGPQSVCKVDQYPYLCEEIKLAKQAIANNKAILGVCLGAQLIAAALGACAEPSPHKEIGVFPVELTDEGKKDPLFSNFPEKFTAMHWHNDMPGIPDGAVLLAKSAGCPRQAFRYGDRIYGFQFHLEITSVLMEKMVEHCAEDLKPGTFVQAATELLSADLVAINQKMHTALDYFADLIKYSSANEATALRSLDTSA